MRRRPDPTTMRWMIAGAIALVVVQAVVFLALAGPGERPQPAPPPDPHDPHGTPDVDDGVVRPTAPASQPHPTRPCRAAHGTCVGLEDGACARGTIGDPVRFSCGSPALRCCLP